MKKVVLKDGTEIFNCLDSTTSNEIVFARTTYAEAGAVFDLVNDVNASSIQVFDEEDKLITKGADLILLHNFTLDKKDDDIIGTFKTRVKTSMEKMQDEIVELQEAVIGE